VGIVISIAYLPIRFQELDIRVYPFHGIIKRRLYVLSEVLLLCKETRNGCQITSATVAGSSGLRYPMNDKWHDNKSPNTQNGKSISTFVTKINWWENANKAIIAK